MARWPSRSGSAAPSDSPEGRAGSGGILPASEVGTRTDFPPVAREERTMIAIATLAAVLFTVAPPQEAESWETLSRAAEKAFEEHTEWSADAFQPRFLAIAEQGEGRAVLWLLANLADANAPRVFELVERGGEAEWVGQALHSLGLKHARFDALRLAELLERLMGTAKSDKLRAQAAFARARTLDASDAKLASELRLWGAALACKGIDLEPDAKLSPSELEDLGAKVIETVTKASRGHFEDAYYAGPNDVYFPRAGAPPDPEQVWGPVVEDLANRGVRAAMSWALSNAPWQLDDAGKQRLIRILDQLTSAPLPADQVDSFNYTIGGLAYRLGIGAVEPRIRRLIELTPEESRARLLFGLGDALCSAGGEDAALRERGLACLREVQERWPASDSARDAEGRIFRYTKLVVGMPCPDFETVDADGTPFKLSDYKGKVTVVGFWGFW
jgi:hypothetical protein